MVGRARGNKAANLTVTRKQYEGVGQEILPKNLPSLIYFLQQSLISQKHLNLSK